MNDIGLVGLSTPTSEVSTARASMDARTARTISWQTLLVGGGVVALLFWRRPDGFTNPQLWAEDGTVFFLEAKTLGQAALWQPAAGYYHLINRLIAAIASRFDPQWVPIIYNYAAILLSTFVSLRFLSRRLRLPAKPLLALSLVLVPHTGEVFINLTNTQWLTAVLLLQLLLMDEPSRPTEYIADGAILLLAGLSGPFSAILAPVFLWRCWRSRQAGAIFWLLLILVCAAAQLAALVHGPPRAAAEAWSGAAALAAILRRMLGSLFFGAFAAHPVALGLCSAAIVLLASTLGPRTAYAVQKQTLWLCLLLLLLPLVIVVRVDLWAADDLSNGDRYFFLPKLIILWMLIVELAGARAVRRLAGLSLVWIALVNVPGFRTPPYQDHHWSAYCPALRRGEAVEIPINPGWRIEVPEQR